MLIFQGVTIVFTNHSKLSRFLTTAIVKQRQKITLCKEKWQGWKLPCGRWQGWILRTLKKHPSLSMKNSQHNSPRLSRKHQRSPYQCANHPFFTKKSGQWTELNFLFVFFLAKGQERNHISHPIQQKESMNLWANCYKVLNVGWFPLPKPQIAVWGRYNLPKWLVCINSSWWFQHVSELNSFEKKLPTLDPFCRTYLNLGLETNDNKQFFELSPGKTWRNSFFATTKTWEFSSPPQD